MIVVQRQTELLQVVAALRATGGFAKAISSESRRRSDETLPAVSRSVTTSSGWPVLSVAAASIQERSVGTRGALELASIAPDQLLIQLAETGSSAPCSLICEIELTRFDTAHRQIFLPLLWHYILEHRNSNIREELVAVGAAVRKYVANMPMNQMGTLGTPPDASDGNGNSQP